MTVPFPGAGEFYDDGILGTDGGAPGDRNASLLAYRMLEPVGVALIQRIADALPLMSRLNDLLPTVSLIDLNALSGLATTLVAKVDVANYITFQTAQAAAFNLKLNISDYTPGAFAPIGVVALLATKLDASAFTPSAYASAVQGITLPERAAIAALGSASTHAAADFMPANSVTQYTDAMARAAVTKEYRITWFWTTALTASEVLMIHTFTDAPTFPANFSTAQAHVDGVNPTATQTLDVQKNNISVGTITISSAGAFTFASTGGVAVVFAVGDRMKIVGQAGVETSTNVSGTFRGNY